MYSFHFYYIESLIKSNIVVSDLLIMQLSMFDFLFSVS